MAESTPRPVYARTTEAQSLPIAPASPSPALSGGTEAVDRFPPSPVRSQPAESVAPSVLPAREFPPVLRDALWTLIDAVRADSTYARNLRVRLAVFQGKDEGPLTGVIDAMAVVETE